MWGQKIFLQRTNLDKKISSTRHILTTDKSLSCLDILIFYQKRWAIEVFHRIFKHRFQPKHWQLHKKGNSIESMNILSNLCTLCLFTLDLVSWNITKSFGAINISNLKLRKSFISYSLTKVRNSLISKNKIFKIFTQKET